MLGDGSSTWTASRSSRSGWRSSSPPTRRTPSTTIKGCSRAHSGRSGDSPDASDFAAARRGGVRRGCRSRGRATKAALRELQTRHDGLQRRHDVLSQLVRASPGGAAMLATAPPLPAAPAPPPAAPLAAAAKAAAKQQQQLLQLPPAYGAASEKSATAKTPRGPRLIGPYPPRPELMQEHNISKASLTDPAHRAGFEAWQFAKEFMAQRMGFPSSATLNAINAQTSGSGVGSASAASPPSPASSWAGMATSLKTTSTTSSTTQPSGHEQKPRSGWRWPAAAPAPPAPAQKGAGRG